MDLRQPGEFAEYLFAARQTVACDWFMQVMDTINGRWGRGTMSSASVPVALDWGMPVVHHTARSALDGEVLMTQSLSASPRSRRLHSLACYSKWVMVHP